MKRASWGMFFVLVLMLAMAQQRPAHAGIINGTVSLDTSGLSGTFELGFVLVDGSTTGDANNTVTLGNFGFGGGSAGAVDALLTTSGASGDFASGVTIVDSEFFNVFAQTFTAGTVVTFDFGLTTNVDAGGTPDQFSLALFQSDGTPIPSSDASGALLVANIDSAQPAFLRFATELTPAPIVTLAATAPEPSSMLLLVVAVMAALWSVRARLRGAHAASGPDRTVSMYGMRPPIERLRRLRSGSDSRRIARAPVKLEELMRLILGSDSAFLQRAPLAGMRRS